MKSNLTKKILVILIAILPFISFPYTIPTAIGNNIITGTLDYFEIDMKISSIGDNGPWSDNLGQVLEGTFLYYFFTATNSITQTLMISLFDSVFPNQVITTTLLPGGQTYTSPTYQITATLGTQTNVVTGTAPVGDVLIVHTDKASYTGVTSTVPEPVTMLLVGFGLLGLWGLRRKFKR